MISSLLSHQDFTWRNLTSSSKRQARTRRFHSAELLESRQLLAADVVINEIHFDPDVKTEPVEFIELHNAGDEAADVSSWSIADAVSFAFPAETVLPANGYLVLSQSPAEVQIKFGIASQGPFAGRLSNERDRIVLLDAGGRTVDEVAYKRGFPWPTVGDAPGNSIELINPRFDNDLGGNWRPSLDGPTPDAANSRLAENAAPQMRQVEHQPRQPKTGQAVTITVKITDPDQVAAVRLDYQIVAPGDYVSINDARYATDWTTVGMRDDGMGGDQTAGDDVYTAILAGDLQRHRHLTRYRFTAEDGLGAKVTGPYEDDPVPNFAYFVFDGVPDWEASIRPGADSPVTYPSSVLESLPVYQLITTRQAHVDSQQLTGAVVPPYTDNEYPWQGTLVYDGEVYDHIRYRARGGSRYGRGKNPWKFDFNRGHDFQARDNYGENYDSKWRKLNLSPAHRGSPTYFGEQGMHEAVGFALFNLAGVEASNTNFIHFRIIEDAEESSADQYRTDFQGLYLTIEQADGRFLDEHGLSDANLYKMRQSRLRGTTNNQGPTQPPASEDLSEFADGMVDRSVTDQWLSENVDLERFYSYRTILEGIHHYDTGSHNHLLYHDPDTNLWSIHPWDLDFTWQNDTPGSANDPFSFAVLRSDAFLPDYRNRARELRDLLFNPEQTGMLIDEIARFIYTPDELSFVDANRAMWDLNPETKQNAFSTGRYYQRAPETGFAGMIQLMKDYVVERGEWIDTNVLTDESSIPETPELTYTGSLSFPLNGLTYETSAFSSPDASSFGAMQWRIAEVTDTESPVFDPTVPRNYEITAVWESEELERFRDTMQIPGHDLREGANYRVRVRLRDEVGRWSHWSEPHEFIAGPPGGPIVEGLRITEINYHPHDAPADSPFDDNDFEFLEFQNVGRQMIEITGVRIEDGVEFTFANAPTQVIDASFDGDVAGLTYADDPFNGTINSSKAAGQLAENGGSSGGALQVVLGPGEDVAPITILSTSFDDGEGIFTYAADAFNRTDNPSTVAGSAADGSLRVFVGPGDTGGPASGAWSTTFSLAEAATVEVALTHRMSVGPGLESTEFGEVILEIDGVRYDQDASGSLARLAGKGPTETGPSTSIVRIPSDAGEHTIAFGAFNNQATHPDEFVEVMFDELVVTVPEPGAIGPSSGAWSRTFESAAKGDIRLAFDYRMLLGNGMELNEYGQLILEFDGVRLGRDVHESVEHLSGAAGGIDTGWVRTEFVIPQVMSGQHTIAIGAYSNQATAADEFVEAYFDNLSIELVENVLMAPGETAIVVANRAAFDARYGNQFAVVGEFASGKLSNGGEAVRIREPRGGVVQQFGYDDQGGWPDDADGKGKTLEVIDAAGNYDDPANWRASTQPGGSLGVGVTVGDPPTGDFDGDGRITGFDFLRWQANFSIIDGTAAKKHGDADGDGNVDDADLALWKTAFDAVTKPVDQFAAILGRANASPRLRPHVYGTEAPTSNRALRLALIAILQESNHLNGAISTLRSELIALLASSTAGDYS